MTASLRLGPVTLNRGRLAAASAALPVVALLCIGTAFEGSGLALRDDPLLARAARGGAADHLSVRVGLSARVVCSGG